MPLSEREQALLEQLERALTADDPGLASRLRGGRVHARSRLVLAGAVIALGAAAVVVAAVRGNASLVVAGSVVVLAGGLLVVAVLRAPAPAHVRGRVGVPRPTPARVGGPGRPARVSALPPRGRPRSAFMSRLEQRWEARRQGRRTF